MMGAEIANTWQQLGDSTPNDAGLAAKPEPKTIFSPRSKQIAPVVEPCQAADAPRDAMSPKFELSIPATADGNPGTAAAVEAALLACNTSFETKVRHIAMWVPLGEVPPV
jgi:hypothetical protein